MNNIVEVKNEMGLTVGLFKEYLKDKKDDTLLLVWSPNSQNYDPVVMLCLIDEPLTDRSTGQVVKPGSILMEPPC